MREQFDITTGLTGPDQEDTDLAKRDLLAEVGGKVDAPRNDIAAELGGGEPEALQVLGLDKGELLVQPARGAPVPEPCGVAVTADAEPGYETGPRDKKHGFAGGSGDEDGVEGWGHAWEGTPRAVR